MKLLIISDIHGDADCLKQALDVFTKEKCDKILILGDILYHGPRNDLPLGYAPKRVISMLNPLREKIIAVRGNCDAEVDGMVLCFPIMADYTRIVIDGLSIFATHGHKFNTDTPELFENGEILLHGHTHVLTCQEFGKNNLYLNPGSISLPKEDNPKTYMIYEKRKFTVLDFNNNIILEKKL